jgi:SAM-dependent methyltransferase
VAGEDIEEQRERLLDGWDDAAKGWGRQADRTQSAALPISEWMIAHTEPRPGEQVLELAAGPGDTGFIAARLIQPGGTLICSDAVAGMLDVARERAAELGLDNVEFKQLQLEWIDLPTASVDIVLCRWALMLIIDPAAALRECRRVLKPGGRLALAVWDTPDTNPWAIVIQRALVELGHVEPTTPGGPGMFALSDPARLTELLEDAGFLDIDIEPVAIRREYASVVDWLGETRDLSRQFATVWAGLGDEQRQALRDHVAAAAAAYTDQAGALVLPGRSLAVAASA